MAAPIIEIHGRHGNLSFHPVDAPVTRLGRALDNDIILTDPTVSPYHLVIRRDADGHYELHPISEENGVVLNRRQLREPIALDDLPLDLEVGRTRLRILDRAQPVAPTRLLSCREGGTCLFGSWGWALIFFAVFTLLSALDNYLSTPLELSWQSYWRDQTLIMLVALGLTVGLLMVNRITSHRWDYAAAVGFTSVMLSLALLIDLAVPFANYFFTSEKPGFALSLAWSFLIMPVALSWFLIRLNHGGVAVSVVLVFALLSPAAYYQAKEVIDYYDLLDDFSKKAFYSDSLVPWDHRIQSTVSIDAFAREGIPDVAPTAIPN